MLFGLRRLLAFGRYWATPLVGLWRLLTFGRCYSCIFLVNQAASRLGVISFADRSRCNGSNISNILYLQVDYFSNIVNISVVVVLRVQNIFNIRNNH